MSFELLRLFVQDEMPVLFNELNKLGRARSPRILNAATGLDYTSDAPMYESSRRYLEVFEREKARGSLILGAMTRGLIEAAKMRREDGVIAANKL